jgi:hypothetical protein
MTTSATPHAWMATLRFAGSASSALHVPEARAAACVLDRLAQDRPQAHAATEAII